MHDTAFVRLNSRRWLHALCLFLLTGTAHAALTLDELIQSDDKERLIGYITALAAGPAGELYSADSRDGLLVRFNGNERAGIPLAGDKRPFSSSRVRGLVRLAHDRFAIANETDGKIAIIDATGQLLQRFGDGGNDEGRINSPSGLAYSANQRLYVADKHNNRISVFGPDGIFIRTLGGTEGARLETPEQVYVDRQERVYTFERRDAGTISIFSHDGMLLKRIGGSELRKLANAPSLKLTTITVDPASALLYLGDSENGHILRYDWERHQILDGFGTKGRQRGQFSDIAALELLADGRLAVADNDNKKIEVYRLPALERPLLAQINLPTVSGTASQPMECDIAYRGMEQQTWCMSERSANGRSLNAAGEVTTTLQAKLEEPVAAAIGSERIAVIDDKKLKIFGKDGALLFSSGDNRAPSSDPFGGSQFDDSTDGKFGNPSDVYLRGDRIYVSDKANRRVQIFTRDGLYLEKIANPKSGPWLFEEPVSVAVDARGHIYVADSDLKQVLVFDKNRQLAYRLTGGELPNEKFEDIFDLELDADSNLYVLCATPRNAATVQVYRNARMIFSFGARSADPAGVDTAANLSITLPPQRIVTLYDKGRKQLLGFNYLQVPDTLDEVAVIGGSLETVLRWPAPVSHYVTAFRIYAAATAAGPYQRLTETQEPHARISHQDDREWLYYRISAVSSNGVESALSEPLADRFQAGYRQYQRQAYTEAAEIFRSLVEERPAHGETVKYLGLTYMAQGQHALARHQFETLSGLAGFEHEGSRLQIETLRAAGDTLAAKAVVDRLLATDAASGEIQLICGELSLALNDAIGAVQCLEEALKHDAANIDAHLMMADAYIRLGVLERGQAELEQAQALAPENALVWRRSARIQQQLGNHEQAILLFGKASELDPGDLSSRLAAAQSHLTLKQYDQVRNIAVSLAGHKTTEGRGHHLLGIIALAEAKHGEALISLTKSTRADPLNAAAWLALADTYGHMGQPDMVRPSLVKAVEADPKSFDAALRLGLHDHAGARYADATGALARAVSLNPAHYDSRYQLADSLYRQGEWMESLEQANEANRLEPSRIEPLALLASISARQGKNGAAINHLKQALTRQPNDLGLQLQLGALYVDNNMFDLARITLEKAALLDATRAEPHAQLGRLYLKRRLFDDAIATLDKAVGLSPSQENRLLLDTAYAEKNKSLEFKSNAPQIVLKDLQLKQVFSAAYKQYANEAIGSLRLQNISGVDYGNLKLTFEIKGYMDFPASHEITELKANSSQEIPLYAAFNNKILEIDEDTGVQVEVSLRFVRDNRDDAITLTQPMTIYGKNAILWARPNMVGAFVTPKDDTLRDFVRQAINENRPQPGPLNTKLVTAMTLFNSLSAHGIKYVTDPNSPYSRLAADQVDYVQFARETLRLKSGDCDDLSVLLSAALENLGIETAIIDVPGHLLLMFNSGLPAEESGRISLQENLLAIRGGTVWVPLEATMIATSFAEAWSEGARKYHENLAAKTLQVIPLHQAWEEYLPVTLKPAGYQIAQPERERVSPLVVREYNLLLEKSLDRQVRPYRALAAANPDNEGALMQIAIIYARNGLYDKAFMLFDEMLAKNPDNSTVYNNRGNVYFTRGEFERALKSYLHAEQHDGIDPGIKVNLAMTYYKLGNLDDAKKKFIDAIRLSETVRNQYTDFARLLSN